MRPAAAAAAADPLALAHPGAGAVDPGRGPCRRAAYFDFGSFESFGWYFFQSGLGLSGS
jgi:hypothetical protein